MNRPEFNLPGWIFAILFFAWALALTGCQGSGDRFAEIQTEAGNMTVRLYGSTPEHRDNFIKLVEMGFYEGLLFHRVVRDFIIQGGDPTSQNAVPGAILGQNGPAYTLPAEIGAPHVKGALVAARQVDAMNPEKASDGYQFFIVQGHPQTEASLNQLDSLRGSDMPESWRKRYLEVGGAPQLDGEYTVFGEVVAGFEVIDKIGGVPRDINDRPLKDIHMSIRLLDRRK